MNLKNDVMFSLQYGLQLRTNSLKSNTNNQIKKKQEILSGKFRKVLQNKEYFLNLRVRTKKIVLDCPRSFDKH